MLLEKGAEVALHRLKDETEMAAVGEVVHEHHNVGAVVRIVSPQHLANLELLLTGLLHRVVRPQHLDHTLRAEARQ